MSPSVVEKLGSSRPVRVALALAFAVMLAVGTLDVRAAVGSDPERPEIVDFHAFHIAGRLALEGRFADAYDMARMEALERAEGNGRDVFMPFAYPPVVGLVVAPLALLPVAPAFVLFGAATLSLYLAALGRLAGPWFTLSALVAAPAMVIDLRIGQNGLLTGGLVALAAGLSLHGRGRTAGACAGLLAFKPQVAVGLALSFLLRRQWRALAAAALSAAAAAVLALSLFGPGTVAAFGTAAAAASRFVAPGVFPLHRMVSAYAFGTSLGLSRAAAMALQAAVALAVLGSVPAAAGLRADGRAAVGLCLMSTPFVSPYIHDYDLTVFCAGLALVLPDLALAMRPRSLGALLAGVVMAESTGLILNPLGGSLPSLGCPILLTCFGAAVLALRGRRAAVGPAFPLSAGVSAP